MPEDKNLLWNKLRVVAAYVTITLTALGMCAGGAYVLGTWGKSYIDTNDKHILEIIATQQATAVEFRQDALSELRRTNDKLGEISTRMARMEGERKQP